MSDSEEEVTKVLNGVLIKRHLSELGRNAEGTGFGYLKLEIENREVENISEELSTYQQLKFIHLSGNKLNNLSVLSKLPNILRLELANNKITALDYFNNEETFTNLQFLDVSKNFIRNLVPIKPPKLVHLILNYNEIINTELFLGHPSLRILELRGNKINNITGLKSMPRLEELYLCENNISFFDTLEELPSLKKLHLRKNNISNLEEEKLPDLPELTYLNLRENQVKDINKLANLKKFQKLERMIVSNNPCWTSQELVKEILIFMPRVSCVNKQVVTEVDQEVSYQLASERFMVAEAARKEAERKAQEALDKENS